MLGTMLKFLKFFSLFGLLGLIAGGGLGVYGLWYFNQGLPDHDVLKNYSPPTATRVHAGDGKMIAEYAEQRRMYVPVANISERVKNAFIAAEDKDFYHHYGIDPMAIVRAAFQNVKRAISGGRPIGASTITQQVAKNFLLSNELSLTRKVREGLLAIRIERALGKDAILDLYLNEIYLGRGAYGVAAAALSYFDRSLAELSIAEVAFLAALPKAPNNYNPWRYPERAKQRRDWVIGRMLALGYITESEAERAISQPIDAQRSTGADSVDARYFVEHVRKELAQNYGVGAVNRDGLSVRTTLDTRLQQAAYIALTDGLIAYDRRHGYRGPLRTVAPEQLVAWRDVFTRLPATHFPRPEWQRAIVLEVTNTHARIGLEVSDNEAVIVLSGVKWARKFLNDSRRGGSVKAVDQVLQMGEMIIVAPEIKPEQRDEKAENVVVEADIPDLPRYDLQQYPTVNGALVALDPFTGRVLAMQGGLSFEQSEFNRATQANRQPGSAFKPFVYLSALEVGYTPSTRILDAPFVLDQGPNQPKWKPANYSQEFYGLSPMRIGIEKSRNLMTIRLAQQIGMPKIAELTQRFGVIDDLPLQLSASLGAHETTLLKITRAYAQLVNGGKKITPTTIDRVQDRYGKTLFLHDKRQCADCDFHDQSQLPLLIDNTAQLVRPEHAYQITSMLEGVVKRGTGRSIAKVGYPLAGKTGTTNDSFDSWFVGFSPNLAVGIFVGFDNPRSLGRHPAGYQETGSSVAAPIFRQFMSSVLEGSTKIPFRVPDNVYFIKVDPRTGSRAQASNSKWIEEAFVQGTSPEADAITISQPSTAGENTPAQTGKKMHQATGLY